MTETQDLGAWRVPLTKGYEATVDINDAPLVTGFRWQAMICLRPDGSIRNVYAVRKSRTLGQTKSILMHRQILGAADCEVDHADGDGLNNRRSNLRPASKSQNQMNSRLHVDNTSGAKGVSWRSDRSKWAARIAVKGKNYSLGHFRELSDAVAAYARASGNLHGDFGRVK